ncbi:M15 family metallopeptidase [Vibrio sp. Of7-15]|uniref:M15 family metallopeptidase n=1 Tax=Vibrio sp. Of7-15 TaxID=2724879 RepID=UPI001EF271D6|nr:M15 family metallopeptidase [Vibrio sp. Of7-15]MCG7498437.1 M15 family metallopeptidase [Vibrio sp. Of7-15]
MIPSQLIGRETGHLAPLAQIPSRLLHTKVHRPFLALQSAAQQAGFDLAIASSFRDFDRQLMIWNNKFHGLRPILNSQSQPLDPTTLTESEKIHAIMRWSALPGASRHHWGTDLDVYAKNCLPNDIQLQLEPWEYETGHQAEFSQWLNEQAGKFDFFFPYQNDQGGVAQEPWHISFAPISHTLLPMLTPELLVDAWHNTELAGKTQILSELDKLYTRYITNIYENCNGISD